MEKCSMRENAIHNLIHLYIYDQINLNYKIGSFMRTEKTLENSYLLIIIFIFRK